MLPLFLFQSTLPRGERLNSIPVIASRHNFNPRSREGSDSIIHILKDHFYISIHAPARGATGCSKEQRYSLKISIHAPARGATTIYWVFVACVGISIHAPARGATSFSWQNVFCKIISIHAPARGATAGERVKLLLAMHFNPRSREGSDRFQHS